MKYELIIFDCDGVLVDSEPISNRVLSAMLNEIGLPFTPDLSVQTFGGRSEAETKAIIERQLGEPLRHDFFEEYHQRMFEEFRRDLKPVEGVMNVLDSLTMPACVASSGPHAKMRTTLGTTGLLPRFEGRLFSATEVENSKPAPDVFLYAASKMGFPPENCAVIEDTVVGVQAGIAAGMTVFGYAAHSDEVAMKEAGARVFLDMRELPALLEDMSQ